MAVPLVFQVSLALCSINDDVKRMTTSLAQGVDPMRYIGASKVGRFSLFASYNRDKQSIRINSKDSACQELVSRLISDIGIVIHNVRPGVMDKLNLGSEQLSVLNS